MADPISITYSVRSLKIKLSKGIIFISCFVIFENYRFVVVVVVVVAAAVAVAVDVVAIVVVVVVDDDVIVCKQEQ